MDHNFDFGVTVRAEDMYYGPGDPIFDLHTKIILESGTYRESHLLKPQEIPDEQQQSPDGDAPTHQS